MKDNFILVRKIGFDKFMLVPFEQIKGKVNAP